MDTSIKPVVLVISSMVADGSVGGRVVSFAMERLGFPTWFIPTVILPRHPGRQPSVREETSNSLLKGSLADIQRLANERPVAAVLTGYIGHADQAGFIADTIREIRKTNPQLVHICDPVLGDQSSHDHAGLYVAETTAEAIRDRLWNSCDIATPNAFELNWLCTNSAMLEAKSATPETLKAMALGAPAKAIAVTSVAGLMRNHIGNMLVREDGPALLFEHLAMPRAPHGTGDLFAALLLGQFLSTGNIELATERATASLFELTTRAAKSGAEDLPIIAEQASLERPVAMVAKRTIGALKPKIDGNRKQVVFKPSAL